MIRSLVANWLRARADSDLHRATNCDHARVDAAGVIVRLSRTPHPEANSRIVDHLVLLRRQPSSETEQNDVRPAAKSR